jgi:RNA methyltransferase, TrmH family
VERIASRQNPIVKQFRAAAERSDGTLLLDGAHLLEEALDSGLEIALVAVRDEHSDATAGPLVRRAEARGARLVAVSAQVLDAISPVRTPSGIVAIARRPSRSIDAALAPAPQLVLLLADIQDPGNVGAIVRAAEGCGGTGIIVGPGSADPFGWKALRGSMGSAFRLPVVTDQLLEPVIDAARARGIRVIATVPRSGTPLPQSDLRGPVAIVLGGEGSGLPDALLGASDERVTIPMQAPVESLNVAIAAALITYEASRQRLSTREKAR